jgi:hypothetical protein
VCKLLTDAFTKEDAIFVLKSFKFSTTASSFFCLHRKISVLPPQKSLVSSILHFFFSPSYFLSFFLSPALQLQGRKKKKKKKRSIRCRAGSGASLTNLDNKKVKKFIKTHSTLKDTTFLTYNLTIMMEKNTYC